MMGIKNEWKMTHQLPKEEKLSTRLSSSGTSPYAANCLAFSSMFLRSNRSTGCLKLSKRLQPMLRVIGFAIPKLLKRSKLKSFSSSLSLSSLVFRWWISIQYGSGSTMLRLPMLSERKSVVLESSPFFSQREITLSSKLLFLNRAAPSPSWSQSESTSSSQGSAEFVWRTTRESWLILQCARLKLLSKMHPLKTRSCSLGLIFSRLYMLTFRSETRSSDWDFMMNFSPLRKMQTSILSRRVASLVTSSM